MISVNTQIRHILMMRRGPTAKFMPNSFVFPGGLLDKNDYEFPHKLTNFYMVDAQPIAMQGFTDDFAFRIAAIRELYEEAGILLTFDTKTKTSNLITEKDDPSLTEWRQKVVKDPKKFAELFTDTCLANVSLLIPWSNWLTPFGYPKRFDVMFFVAPIKHEIDTDVKYCLNEMSQAEWTTSTKIIERSTGKCKHY
jgi:8-oxo-dGTP pyrophosphatase MutT (NUDIX family)